MPHTFGRPDAEIGVYAASERNLSLDLEDTRPCSTDKADGNVNLLESVTQFLDEPDGDDTSASLVAVLGPYSDKNRVLAGYTLNVVDVRADTILASPTK